MQTSFSRPRQAILRGEPPLAHTAPVVPLLPRQRAIPLEPHDVPWVTPLIEPAIAESGTARPTLRLRSFVFPQNKL